MANVAFKKGLLANLPAAISEGTFYITTDERAMYLDVDSTTRVRIGDFQEFATLAALQANTNPSTTALYYVTELNALAKWNGTQYVQINTDTGATSAEATGDGNAIDGVSYDPATRKLTFTKTQTFTTASDVDSQIVDKVGNLTLGDVTYETVKEYVDKKTDGIATDAALETLTQRVTTAEDKINTLDGDETVAGSVDKKITDAIAAIPAQVDYTVTITESSPEGYAKAYTIQQLGKDVAVINIPKDMVVENGSVVTNPDGQEAGTYLKLVLANADESEIFINVSDLIEYVTSGSAAGDQIMVAVSADHKVTATLSVGSVILAQLHADVQAEINKAHEHANKDALDGVTAAKVTAWDAAEQNAKDYADGLAADYDAAGDANQALVDAKAYTDGLLAWGSF